MRARQIDFARNGYPVELVLMHEYHWLPDEIAGMPNRVVQELIALRRLEAERASRR